MNNVNFNTSSQTDKFNRSSPDSRDKESYSSKSSASIHTNALKLGTKKSSSKTDKSSKTRRQSDERPGSEFEITRIVVRSSEPDYFADMEPSVSFKVKDSENLPGQSQAGGLSSKLAMVEDTSQVWLTGSFLVFGREFYGALTMWMEFWVRHCPRTGTELSLLKERERCHAISFTKCREGLGETRFR